MSGVRKTWPRDGCIFLSLLRRETCLDGLIKGEQMKKLYRSRTNAVIGGVCGGIAEVYNFDPTVVRIVFALTWLLGGVGLFIYIVMWVITPKGSAKV